MPSTDVGLDGMCVFGVTAGRKLTGNPASWTVVSDRLYLAKNGLVKTLFPTDHKRVEKARKRWAELSARP